MPGLPAARLGDMHTCPMCAGAPLPVVGVCALNVLVGGLPAARQTDLCACVAPVPVPVDAIVLGSPVVLIGGLPATFMTAPTAKGGALLPPCCVNVLIGMAPMPAVVAIGGLPVQVVVLPDGSVVTQIGPNITVEGTPEFQAAVVNDMAKLYATPTGRDLIDTLNGPGRGPVKIVETAGGNEVSGVGPQGWKQADGSNGTGSGSTLSYNPNRTQIGDGSEPWMTRPPAVALGHELVHCEQAQDGSWSNEATGGTLNDELAAVGLPPYENNDHTENKMRDELGEPARTYY